MAGWIDGIITGVRHEANHYRCPEPVSVFDSYRRTTNGSFFFVAVFLIQALNVRFLVRAPGLFTAALSQADLHNLFEIVQVFSTPELPPLNGLLEPEAVIVLCTAIKGPILV